MMGFTFSAPGVVDAAYLAKVDSFGREGCHAIVFGESDVLSKLSSHRESVVRHAEVMLAKDRRTKNDAVLTASVIQGRDRELTVNTIDLVTGRTVEFDIQATFAAAMVFDQCTRPPADAALTIRLAERTSVQATLMNDWGSYWITEAVVEAPRTSRLHNEIENGFAELFPR